MISCPKRFPDPADVVKRNAHNDDRAKLHTTSLKCCLRWNTRLRKRTRKEKLLLYIKNTHCLLQRSKRRLTAYDGVVSRLQNCKTERFVRNSNTNAVIRSINYWRLTRSYQRVKRGFNRRKSNSYVGSCLKRKRVCFIVHRRFPCARFSA